MSDIVKINAIRVPEGMGEMIEQRFAARGDAMNEVEGFLSFELLRPTAGEDRYFVYTRWESEAAIRAFAGAEVLKAKYYPEDDAFLLEQEPEVAHYQVVARAGES